MKKIISLLISFFVLSSSSSMIISCQREEIIDDCFDENGNNVTTKGWDVEQALEVGYIIIFTLNLSKDIFVDSNSFYQNMNDKTEKELAKTFTTTEGQPIDSDKLFEYHFTFLITNYDSINSSVIKEMQDKDLKDRESGMYLFLNLPNIDTANIDNEPNIDFQYLFITKNSDGTIIGNENNDWFYWSDWNTTNNISPDNQYFFDLAIVPIQNRVVTNFKN